MATVHCFPSGKPYRVASSIKIVTFGCKLREGGYDLLCQLWSIRNADRTGLHHPRAAIDCFALKVHRLFRGSRSRRTRTRATGEDDEVQDALLADQPDAEQLIDEMATEIVDKYIATEGKVRDHFVCCAVGRHRSVAVAELVTKRILKDHPAIKIRTYHVDLLESLASDALATLLTMSLTHRANDFQNGDHYNYLAWCDR